MVFGISASGAAFPMAVMIKHMSTGFGAVMSPLPSEDGFLLFTDPEKLTMTAACARSQALFNIAGPDALSGTLPMQRFINNIKEIVNSQATREVRTTNRSQIATQRNRLAASRRWEPAVLQLPATLDSDSTSNRKMKVQLKVAKYTLPSVDALRGTERYESGSLRFRTRSFRTTTDSAQEPEQPQPSDSGREVLYILHWRPAGRHIEPTAAATGMGVPDQAVEVRPSMVMQSEAKPPQPAQHSNQPHTVNLSEDEDMLTHYGFTDPADAQQVAAVSSSEFGGDEPAQSSSSQRSMSVASSSASLSQMAQIQSTADPDSKRVWIDDESSGYSVGSAENSKTANADAVASLPRDNSALLRDDDGKTSGSSHTSDRSAASRLRTYIESQKTRIDPGLRELRRSFIWVVLMTIIVQIVIVVALRETRLNNLEADTQIESSSLRQFHGQRIVEHVQSLMFMSLQYIDPASGGALGKDPGPMGTVGWMDAAVPAKTYENVTRTMLLAETNMFEQVHEALYKSLSRSITPSSVVQMYNNPSVSLREVEQGELLVREKTLLEMGSQFIQQARKVAYMPLNSIRMADSSVNYVLANGPESILRALNESSMAYKESSQQNLKKLEDVMGIALMAATVVLDLILIGIAVPIVRRIEGSKDDILKVFLDVPRVVVRYLKQASVRRLQIVLAEDGDDGEQQIEEKEATDWGKLRIRSRKRQRAFKKSFRYVQPALCCSHSSRKFTLLTSGIISAHKMHHWFA